MGVSQPAQHTEAPATRAGRGGNHPPKSQWWQKGCASPNPKGRPSIKRFSDAAKAVLAEVDPRTGKSGAETLVELAFRRAKQGSVKQLALLLAYAEGKPAQNVKLTGGVLHAHAWRPLATLTDEQVEQLAAIRKSLSGPEEEERRTESDAPLLATTD
jgi:Family of unknown function (DUF5681)